MEVNALQSRNVVAIMQAAEQSAVQNAMPVALEVGCYQAHAWVALTQGAADYSITNLVRTIGPTGIDLTTDVNVRVLHNMERSQFASDQ